MKMAFRKLIVVFLCSEMAFSTGSSLIRSRMKQDGSLRDLFSLTASPTASPRASPDSIPSLISFLSSAPTENIWSIIQDTEGFSTSTCQTSPPNVFANSVFTMNFEFAYYLYLPRGDLDEAVKQVMTVENGLHIAMTKRALACEYFDSDRTSLVVTELSSRGKDEVLGKCPDVTTSTSQSCWWVGASMALTMYSTLSNTEISSNIISWIEPSLTQSIDGVTILNIEFQGFQNLDLGSGKELAGSDVTSQTNTGVAGLNESNIPNEDTTTGALGALVLALAAIVLAILAAATIRRRKNRQKAIEEHLEEVNSMEIDSQVEAKTEDPLAFVVDDEDLFVDSTVQIAERDMMTRHNAKTCTQPHCIECIDGRKTVFLSLD